MDEQRKLERRYAMLVTRRGELKGLIHKEELHKTKQEIQEVSKQLKESTFKLGRQLHDNPDTAGNQLLIERHRLVMIDEQRKLIEEMKENQSYQDFKSSIEEGIREKDRYGDLKVQEKAFNDDIKKYNEMLKKNNEEYAAEAQQSQEDTVKLRKTLNETMTESELQVQY